MQEARELVATVYFLDQKGAMYLVRPYKNSQAGSGFGLMMKRFYFHILRNGKVFFDLEGMELKNSAQAHGRAVNMMAEMASAAIPLTGDLEVTIAVTDVAENVLFRTHLRRSVSHLVG